MRRDPRYAQWLAIADELESLHSFLYGPKGYWVKARNTYHEVVDLLRSAQWIRDKCATGGWYWWDKTTISARAESPLDSLNHVIGDNGRGSYESSEEGRALLARIERLEAQIAALSRTPWSKP
ncbi:MAG: hypothetical protein J7605_11375 [Variovorax sp.]|nr:hypothetical protein [Variovorax sp.]